ncbi:hypothetical protein PHSY_005744 [Pseudozyma hubeiensis SY62]|uniref:CFEM domain-containing protein n=1 Tax=Pseudozyma hubeiensis (strain SY62) TaxID=1305764 RepID=R9PJ57_PSEHS|nr:hypothetical protein PHSY_005744 [Pseudozyma hubeiensis SY62]GAC98155.1 hypothetical protein PHSY_005744 [Pseudozyma hubeiensis SY62]
MKTSRKSRSSFAWLLLLVLIVAASVSAAGAPPASSPQGGTPELKESPTESTSPTGQTGNNEGSISAPASGNDVQSIIASSQHTMGTSDDSTDSQDDDKASTSGPQNGHQPGGHHGQCVSGCATRSITGVGCGNDFSKPDCFCKSENFIDQTFACINATCPQQFHGAAGVITSICGGVGVPKLNIPGYKSSGNLENMPTITDDPKNNGTNATSTQDGAKAPTPAEGGQNGSGGGAAGVTSTFSMPVGVQTPVASGPSKNGSGTATVQGSSVAAGVRSEMIGVAVALGVAAMTTCIGVWSLF